MIFSKSSILSSIVFLSFLLNSYESLASCAGIYKTEGLQLHAKRSNTLIGIGVGEMAVGLGTSQFKFDQNENDFDRPSTYILMAGALTASSGLVAKDKAPSNKLYKTGLLLEQAQSGSGDLFDELVKDVNKATQKKLNIMVSPQWIKNILVDAELKNTFCLNEKRSKIKDIKQYVVKEITGQEVLTAEESEKVDVAIDQIYDVMLKPEYLECEDRAFYNKEANNSIVIPE